MATSPPTFSVALQMGGSRQSFIYQSDFEKLQSAWGALYKAFTAVVSLSLRKGFAPADFGKIPRWDFKFRLPRLTEFDIWVLLGSRTEPMGPMGTGDDTWKDRPDLSVIRVKGPNAMGAAAVAMHAITNTEKNQGRVDDATIFHRRVMAVSLVIV